jgi:hypothetical protein
MASGHAYRANRPNTWLLRPMLQSEDSPCQPGAVHTWPKADFGLRRRAFEGRADWSSVVQQSRLDPKWTLGRIDRALILLPLFHRR